MPKIHFDDDPQILNPIELGYKDKTFKVRVINEEVLAEIKKLEDGADIETEEGRKELDKKLAWLCQTEQGAFKGVPYNVRLAWFARLPRAYQGVLTGDEDEAAKNGSAG